MKFAVCVLLGLSVAGCWETRRQARAQCEIDAYRTYPSQTVFGDGVTNYVLTCMETRNYEYDGMRCGYPVKALDSTCYKTMGWF